MLGQTRKKYLGPDEEKLRFVKKNKSWVINEYNTVINFKMIVYILYLPSLYKITYKQ